MFIVKYDYSGNYLWSKYASSFTNGNVFGTKILTDDEGNFYIGGYFNGDSILIDGFKLINLSYSDYEIFLAKFDSSGNKIWAKTLQGSSDDVLNSMDIDLNSNLYLTGSFNGYSLNLGNIQITSPYYYDHFFVAKLDSSGTAIWAKMVSPSSGFGSVQGDDISIDATGVNVTGLFSGDSAKFGNYTLINSDEFHYSIFIARFDLSGNVKWARNIADSSYSGSRSIYVSTDNFGHIYMAGQFWSSYIYFAMDTLWNSTGANIFILQFDTTGSEKWGQRNGFNNVDLVKAISADSIGNLFVTGSFQNELKFENDTLNAVNEDLFVIKYDVNGTKLWAKSVYGNYMASGNGIALNKVGNIFITGSFDGTPTVLGNDTITGTPFYQYFVARISFVTVDPNISEICLGDSVVLIASGATNYTWSPSIGLSSLNDSSVMASPDSTTIFTITATVDGFTSSSKSKVIVLPTPEIPEITVNNDTLDAGIWWYNNQWYRNDTLIIGATSQLFIVPHPIHYSQCYKVRQTNYLGCSSFSDEVCFFVDAVNELKNDELIRIFPNPTCDKITIFSNKYIDKGRINVFNFLGEKVYSDVFSGINKTIDFNFISGNYLVNVTYNSEIQIKQIVKQ